LLSRSTKKRRKRITNVTAEAIEKTHAKVAHVFGGGVTGELIQGRFDTDPVHAWFQKRHTFFNTRLIDEDGICRIHDENGSHEWKVPYGVKYALSKPLLWSQIATKYPWYVTWQSPRNQKRLKKKFESLAAAVVFITTRAQYVDEQASVISRTGYDIPPKLRGKLPHSKLGYWCPCCMDARKFYAVIPEQEFSAMKKVWDSDQGRYKYVVRKLRVLKCKHCGITNRDAKFRRSNQPWEVRRFKRGVTRARRRR
jgi:hypothetical protein